MELSIDDMLQHKFFPVPDSLLYHFGRYPAIAYGYLFRASLLAGGSFQLDLAGLARSVQRSPQVAAYLLENLVRAGLVEDLTPDLKNEPHSLRVPVEERIWQGPEMTLRAKEVWAMIYPRLEHQFGRTVVDYALKCCVPLFWDGASLVLGLYNPYLVNLFQIKILPAALDALQKKIPGARMAVIVSQQRLNRGVEEPNESAIP